MLQLLIIHFLLYYRSSGCLREDYKSSCLQEVPSIKIDSETFGILENWTLGGGGGYFSNF